ncbi:hypothetical protein DPMN_180735 [Dreissena polymorpha]|uniref:Uncharacterized protein n=1 Tax=Dreissena polymorpha TaxID=45954 RepID=A0A9D4DC70_DREPO|nr:hypothetical protein DPMN_180735 [Dreissena polymorpha]
MANVKVFRRMDGRTDRLTASSTAICLPTGGIKTARLQESSNTKTGVYHSTGSNDYKAALKECSGILTSIAGPH